MLLATFSFWIMSVAIKSLTLSSYEIIVVRSIAGLAYCLWFSWTLGMEGAGVTGGLWASDAKNRTFRPTDLQLKLALRGLLGFLSLWTQCLSLERLSVGEATVLQYLYPVFSLWLASVLIAEPYTPFDMLLSCLGLVGCIAVVLPATRAATVGDDDFSDEMAVTLSGTMVGVVAGIASAIFQALSYIGVRQVARHTHGLQLLFYFSAVCLPCAVLARVIFARVPWQEIHYVPTTLGQGFWLVLMCVAGIVGQMALSAALRSEKVGDAASLSYLQVPMAFVGDFVFFGTSTTALSVVGALLITFCGLLPSIPRINKAKKMFNDWYRKGRGTHPPALAT
jgi:drug/metabolite transporter (DMT)-like permease